MFVNFGHLFENQLQFYGHTNYASRKVTGGFYFRNPHTRSGVFRGPEVDGLQTLLVGDGVWAETGVIGAGGCSAIPIINHVPDAAALAQVESDPNCFTLYSRFPGGFTPQFGGNLIDYSWVSGLRGFMNNGLTWDASVNIGTSEVDQFIFDTINASLGYDTPTSFEPGSYRQDDVNLNFDVSYNLVEQDHRRVKGRLRPMLGFKTFYNARRVIIGIELAQKIHKRQFAIPITLQSNPAVTWRHVMAA